MASRSSTVSRVEGVGIESPQHLLVDGDGVLFSDHETGQIIRITPA